jgi:predicted MFS family arabinose efflux permease
VTGAPAAPAAAFRGPRVVTAALVSNAVSVGCGLSLFGVFLEPVSAELGLSKAQSGLGHSFGQIANALGSMLLGWWLLSRWLRPVLLGGAACVALGLLALSRVEAGWQAGLVLMLLGAGALCTGPTVTSVLVTHWYSANRGRALGTASTGTTLGTAFLPPIAAALIAWLGWRDALAALGGAMGALLIPIVWAWVVDRPEALGQVPDGRGAMPAAEAGPPLELRAALLDPRIWLVALIFGCAFAGGVVLILFTVPYAGQLGFSLQTGAWVMTARALSGALGKLVFGTLSDHVDRRWLIGGLLVASALLIELFVRARDPLAFALLAGAVGFISAPILPLQQVVIGAVFGRNAFAQVLGLLNLLRFPLQLLAAPLFGLVLDRSGADYALAFRVYVGLFLLGALLLPLLRVPAARRGAA